MKIDVVKLIFDGNESYKILSAAYCCKNLELNSMIDIHYEMPKEATPCNDCENKWHCKYEDSDELCPKLEVVSEKEVDENGNFLGMMIEEIDTYPEPWEDFYTTDYYYYPIHFCPHCGEKIEVKIVNTLDVTDKFLELTKQREDLNSKYRKTDSKKKEAELRHQIQILDKEIDDFYGISYFEEDKYIVQ